MQSLSGFARKYAIMEELDSGFSAGSTPEAFVRLDSWEGRIQASLHVKGLKQGPYTYKLYLIFTKNDKLIPVLAGSMNTTYNGMQNSLEIEAEVLKNLGLKPESVRFAAITAEGQDKKWVPLFSSFEKSYKWDESIRQLLLKKPAEEPLKEETKPQVVFVENTRPAERMNQPATEEKGKAEPPRFNPPMEERNLKTEPEPVSVSPHQNQAPTKRTFQDNTFNRCDINKLEGLLKNNFEEYTPFKRASKGYSWYRVSDLAKLSNIMYMSGVNVPVFANPKILVGLFKFKHILAGLYHGDNGANYYVIGVPAKNENDNKPFETACRWVSVSDSTVRDMGGYWLVYVSLKSGEIVV